jgi:hypothetical protein
VAVWIYAYGKNGLQDCDNEKIVSVLNQIDVDELKILDCIAEITKDRDSIEKHYVQNRKQIEDSFYAKSDTEYKEYLESVNYPDIERDKIVNYFISEGLERERKEKEFFDTQYEKFKNSLIKSEWTKGESNIYFNNLGGFREYGGLRVWFLNDLIGVSGPFEIFSVYSTFQNSIKPVYREYFHSLFKQILRAFKSDFILYTHEWAGLDDEEDKGFNLEKLKEQSDWVNTTSSSIHNMSGFYFEGIINKPNYKP